jgi:hypothetical protein
MPIDDFAVRLHPLTTEASRHRLLAGSISGLGAVLWATLSGSVTAKNTKRRCKNKQRKQRRKRNRTSTPPPPAAAITPDAACIVASNGTSGGSEDERLAQTFTALASGPLVRADLGIEKQLGTTGIYALRLSPVDGSGVPTNQVLAETVVADSRVPDGPSTVSFSFANPAILAAGTEYALVLTRPGAFDARWQVMDTGCGDRIFFSFDQIQEFFPTGEGFDFIFTAFVSV